MFSWLAGGLYVKQLALAACISCQEDSSPAVYWSQSLKSLCCGLGSVVWPLPTLSTAASGRTRPCFLHVEGGWGGTGQGKVCWPWNSAAYANLPHACWSWWLCCRQTCKYMYKQLRLCCWLCWLFISFLLLIMLIVYLSIYTLYCNIQ
jgi:hypothetical protein